MKKKLRKQNQLVASLIVGLFLTVGIQYDSVAQTASCSVLQHVSSTGGSNGRAMVTASGGTAPYSYLWSNGSVSATATGLSVNTYTVTVTDNLGSTASCNVNILLLNYNPDLLFGSCNDLDVILILDESGSIGNDAQEVRDGAVALATGLMNSGARLAVIEFADNAINSNIDGAGPLTNGFNLVDSAYVAILTSYLNTNYNPNGCTNWEDAFDAALSLTTADLVVFMTDGNPTAYNNGGSSTQCFLCTACATALNEAKPKADIIKAEGAHMYGIAVGGSVDLVKISQVTGPDQDIAPGDTVPGDPAFSQADYTAIPFSELQQCLANIANQSCLAALTVKQNPACSGQNNGFINAFAQGGTAPYTFLWSNGVTISSLTNLGAGTYTVTITDANSITSSSVVTLIDPIIVSCTIQSTINVSCFGSADGSASVTGSGGTLPHTFLWSTGDTTAAVSGLPAGSYIVTVSDSAQCSSTCNILITQPDSLEAICTSTDISCNGLTDGTASVNVSGGTSPYLYSWSNGSTASSINGLAQNSYTVSVTDSKGCSVACSVAVSEPTLLTATCSSVNVSCNALADGSSSVNVSGGTIPYSYLWSNGSTDASAIGIAAGTYTVTVTDANNCSTTCSATVTEPTPLVANCTKTNITCNGAGDGTATVSGNGGTAPYSYLWSTGATSAMIGSLTTNVYTATVTDANGCTATCESFIEEPILAVVTCSATEVSCNGGNDAQITAVVQVGVAPYTYLWSDGQTDVTAVGLSIGGYTVTVTDANGCTATCNGVVIEPPPLMTSCDSTNVSCNGGFDGSATVIAGGGNLGYTYLWDLNAGGQTTSTATGLPAGSYTVLVTDAKGCSNSCDVTVNEPAALNLNCLATDASCFGFSTGSVSVVVSGGSIPYTYAWSNGSTDAVSNGLPAGTYTVTITDNNGCTTTCSAIVDQPAILLVNCSATPATCFGFQNGTATVSVSGGTTPYTYAWSNGQSSQTATGLSAGSLSVLVTDANGCTISCTSTITQPTMLTASCSATDALCNGSTDGSATVNAGGGTPPYTYLWDFNTGSQTTATATGLSAGSYSVLVTDGNGCTNSCNAIVSEPASLELNCTATNVSCFGFTNGSVSVGVLGGTAPYSYAWSNGSTDATSNGLPAGTFTVTVTDNHGCSKTCSSTVSQPPVLVLTCDSSAASCNAAQNGTATANPSGGTLPYTYSWSNGQTLSNATGLVAGVYTVIVTDANNCSATCSTTVTEPTEISAQCSAIDASCNGFQDGSTSVIAGGGTPPYTYLWNNGNSAAGNSGLIAGTYTVLITDANSCTATCSAIVSEPDPLTTQCSSQMPNCNGGSNGSASVFVNGGTIPYTYLWSDGQSGATANGLSAGTYTVTVTDNNNCVATCSTVVAEPSAISLTCSATDASCFGGQDGTASVSATGGSPGYSYLWSDGQTNATAIGLSAGSVTVVVTDNNGCTKSCSATVNEPTAVSATCSSTNASCNGVQDGTASVIASGGTPGYTYLWQDGQSTANAINLASGVYVVTVTDNNGCTGTCAANVGQPSSLSVNCSSTPVSCNGGNTGSATASVSGGTPPVSYLWSDGQTTETATGLVAGTYTINVTDINQCSAFCIVTVEEPSALDPACSSTDVSCNNGQDGTVSVLAGGGTPGYTYLWNTGDVSANVGGLSAGTYTVTVTDANGCTASCSKTINEPLALHAACTSTDVSCNGGTDGTATVTVSGGTVNYSYSWSDGQTTATATGLSAGSLSVVVTDANGCTNSCIATVSEPSELFAVCNSSDATCNGFQNGSASVNASGGTPPYAYLWSNGQTGSTSSNTGSGTYTVTVTDAKGCTITCSSSVNEPTAIALICSATSASCNGAQNGTASVAASGGSPGYQYLWQDGQTTGTAINLAAGFYNVTVTDSLGCIANCTSTVGQPSNISVQCSSTSVSCNGGSDGTATANPSGGTAPYTYVWSNGTTSANATGLSAGSYSVTVTDANSCAAFCNVTVSEPAVLNATCSITMPVSFSGSNDGKAKVVASGGNSPYTYSWSNGITSSTATGLGAGTYTVIVTDNKNCIDSCSVILNLVDSNPDLEVGSCDDFRVVVILDESGSIGNSAQDVRDAAVALANGLKNSGAELAVVTFESDAVNADIDGGGVIYSSGFNLVDTAYISQLTTYLTNSYGPAGCTNWEDAFLKTLNLDTADLVVFLTDGNPTAYKTGAVTSFCTNCNACPTALNQAIPRADAIKARGTHMFGVAVGNSVNLVNIAAVTGPDQDLAPGDTMPGDIPFSMADFTAIPFSELAACFAAIAQQSCLGCLADFTNPNCAGDSSGTITSMASGGKAPYNFIWNDGTTNAARTGLNAGLYTVTITDADGITSSCEITLTDPAVLSCSVNGVDVNCHGASNGSATVNPVGGTAPYTYLWSNSQSTSTATGLAAGSLSVLVTDSLGCSTSCSVTINEPSALNLTCSSNPVSCSNAQNGSASVAVNGGTPGYFYLWSDGQSTQTAVGLSGGTYTVTVTDAHQCASTCSVVVIATPSLTVSCTPSDVNCHGGNTGSVSTNINGGTAPFSYLWSDGQVTANAVALVTGTYTVTVTDANGCSGTCSSTVNEPTRLTVSCSATDVSCNGGSDGDHTATVSGGTPPYSYFWSSGNPVAGGYFAGTYTVTVTDANGCTATCSTTINEPPAITCLIEDTICTVEMDLNNYPHGTKLYDQFASYGITVTAMNFGGKPDVPVVFNSGLIGGTLDPDLEVNIGHLIILPNDTNDVNNDNLVDVPCDNPAGGVLIFDFENCVNVNSFQFVDQDDANTSFAWTVDSLGNTIDSVLIYNAGDGSVQNIILNSQCVSTLVIYLNSSGGVANFNLECPVTAGQNGNASLDLTAGGGTPGYTYLWSNGETTEDLSGVPAGIYTVTITDSNGCTSTCSSNIGAPANRFLSCIATSLNVSACANADGEASVIAVIGGVPPYSYSWNSNPVQNTATATGLPDALYFVTVTDVNGTSVIEAVNVGKDAAITSAITSVNASCYGGGDGEITIVPSGGVPPYSYLWYDGNVDDDRTDLHKGTHTVTVTDASGCTVNYQLWVDHAPQIVAVAAVQPVLCNGGSDGVVTPSVSGGTPPYTYKWSNGSVNAVLTNAAKGTYFCTITDAHGCSKVISVWVNAPSQLRGGATSKAATCRDVADGEFHTAMLGGTPPYSYQWSDGGTTAVGRTDLGRGNWTVTVTDNNGCSKVYKKWINSPTKLTVAAGNLTNATCDGGSNGRFHPWTWGAVAPYSYLWNDGSTVKNRNDLPRGLHTVVVTDANGCTTQSTQWIDDGKQIWVNTSSTPVTTPNGNDGTAFAAAGNTVGPYSYSWNCVPVQNTQTATGLSQGFYIVKVTDANGCIKQEIVNVVYNGGTSKSAVNDNAWTANIYPNPSTESNIFINLRDALGNNVSFSVIDMLGQTVMQRDLKVDNNDAVFEITVPEIGRGVYFVRMESAEQSQTIRWIIK